MELSSMELQLEAIKLLQDWSMWIITISSAFIGTIGFAIRDIEGKSQAHSAKLCIAFLLATVFMAVMLVGALPSITLKIGNNPEPDYIFGIVHVPSLYAIKYLDLIPLWILISLQRLSFLAGILFGARLVWLRLRWNS